MKLVGDEKDGLEVSDKVYDKLIYEYRRESLSLEQPRLNQGLEG